MSNVVKLFETYSMLSRTSIKKNCLLKPVPVGLLSLCFNIIFPVVQSIVNKSFKEADFPDQLKQAAITQS